MDSDERTVLDLLLGRAYDFKAYPTIGVEEIYDDVSLIIREMGLYYTEYDGSWYSWPVDVEPVGIEKEKVIWLGR